MPTGSRAHSGQTRGQDSLAMAMGTSPILARNARAMGMSPILSLSPQLLSTPG